MNAPTAADIRAWSKLDFGTLGYATDPDLQRLVDRALAYIRWATGQAVDANTVASIVPMVEQAVQYKTEALAFQDQPDLIETAGDFMLISSFSVGSYSESRRSLKDLQSAGMIDSDPRVNSALWPILTDEMRDFWLGWISGQPAPAGFISEILWSPEMYSGEAGLGGLGVEAGGYNYVPSPFPIWPN